MFLLRTNPTFSLENKQKHFESSVTKTLTKSFTINLVHAFQGSTARNFVKNNLIINNTI